MDKRLLGLIHIKLLVMECVDMCENEREVLLEVLNRFISLIEYCKVDHGTDGSVENAVACLVDKFMRGCESELR